MSSYFSGGNGSPVGFDESGASSAGYSQESIVLAKDLATYTNSYADKNRTGDPSKTERVSNFFACATNNISSLSANTEVEVFSACSDAGYTQVECTCGTWTYPKPTEGTEWPSNWSTADSAHTWLLNDGYHRTYWPYARSNDPPEYTKPRTYQPNLCHNDSFRWHGIIQQGSTTHYKVQTYANVTPPGEPNPEVNEYTWPNLLWPAYAAWWHNQDFSH